MENLFKPIFINNLTPKVKLLSLGSQLQGFRCLRNSEGETLYEIKTFPGPKKGYLLSFDTEGKELLLWPLEDAEQSQKLRKGFEVASDPVQLYIKAHAVNQRLVEETIHTSPHIALEWQLQSTKLTFEVTESKLITVKVDREAQKPFRRSIRLAPLTPPKNGDGVNSEILSTPKRESKEARLFQKIQADINESRLSWERLQLLCQYLEVDPRRWGEVALDQWPTPERDVLEWLRSQGKVPSFQMAFRAEAFELFHKMRRRFHKKLLGAQKRMSDLLILKEEGQSVVREPAKQGGRSRISSDPKTREGTLLVHPSGLKVKLGRSRTENAELFRRAGSRDLWFHIRGLGGGHVWVPRGQPHWGAKMESLREDLRIWVAQVALYNSKGRSSGNGIVDYTEKRHLKALKGEEGSLSIQRSQTVRVEIDVVFEAELLKISRNSQSE